MRASRSTDSCQETAERIANADDYLSGTFLDALLPKGEKRTKELPLNLAVVDFG